MHQVSVLAFGDNALERARTIAALNCEKEIKVIGEGKNSTSSLEMVQRLKPDIIIMDIDFPGMNALEAIEQIMAFSPVPILVITKGEDAKLAFAALSQGALEVIPGFSLEKKNIVELVSKIKLLSKVKVITHVRGKRYKKETAAVQKQASKQKQFNKVIAIASSTGGPKALSVLLSTLPKDLSCPVVIAQHITNGFVPGLVEWLSSISKLNVKEGKDREVIAAGTVYISPADRHMKINSRKKIVFIEKKQRDIYCPSCDILLSSVADVFQADSIGIILTGMGSDGVSGMEKIKEAGGVTIAQDEASSVIFGMPKVAIGKKCIHKILPLKKISNEITCLLNTR